MRSLLSRISMVATMLVLCAASLATTTVYRFRVVDDTGAVVPGCTFTQGTTKSFNSSNLGTNVTQVLAPTDLLDGNYAVAYDPESTNGEILVTWAVTKPGGWAATITLQNASVSLALTKDSSRVLNADVASSTLATAAVQTTINTKIGTPSASVSADIAAVLTSSTANGTAITGLPASVWANTTRTLTAFAFNPVVAVGSYASGQDPATLVLDVAAAGHNTAGTTGAKISSAASAGDPWATALPAAYAPGSAGYIVGTNLNAAVSSRMATFGLPTNFAAMLINGSGQVSHNLTQILDPTNTGDTVGGALIAARAQGFGKWVIAGTTLTIYAADGTTVLKTFTISPAPTASSRQ